MKLHVLYYKVKPLIPRRLQVAMRRQIAFRKRRWVRNTWPIDPAAGTVPEGWPGWPDGRKFALVLSHDVDTAKGYNNVLKLAALEKQLGFRSSFNFVPERYGCVSLSLLDELRSRGFGVGVHGLKHDGSLFLSRAHFKRQAPRVNAYLKMWNTKGFTAPSMLRNLDWMAALDIEYSTSSFDTDPFEPQPEGVRTIFPFWFGSEATGRGYVELPYTLPQDHCLFVLLKEKDISIWKKKLHWIAEKGGMALLNSHPDYMSFGGKRLSDEEYPVEYYLDFLEYVQSKYEGKYWNALAREVSSFLCKANG